MAVTSYALSRSTYRTLFGQVLLVTQFSGENPQNGTIESPTSIPHRLFFFFFFFFGDIMLHSADVSELDDGPPQI